MKLEEITSSFRPRTKKNIGKFLSSLPPNVWLTVVEASDDQTAARILKLRPARTRIFHAPCNVSMARQWGAEQAHNRWLLFSDADVVLPQGYFERLSALAEDGVIYGCKLPPINSRIISFPSPMARRFFIASGSLRPVAPIC